MMQQRAAYIGGAAAPSNAEGKPTLEKTVEFLRKFMRASAAWITRKFETRSRAS